MNTSVAFHKEGGRRLASLLLFALFFSIVPGLRAQIHGRLLDARSGRPVAGAAVRLLLPGKTGHAVYSDAAGRFELSEPKAGFRLTDAKLSVKHLAYEPLILPLRHGGDLGVLRLQPAVRELRGLTLTSTRTLHHLEDVPVPVMQVSAPEIERLSPSSTSELLYYALPAVSLREHGFIPHIEIQGFDASYVDFLIDGEEMSGLNQGTPDLRRIDPSEIERIEFVKGAGSALYGSNAVAGVLNIITKKATRPLSVDLSAGLGQRGTRNASLSLGMHRKGLSDRLSLSHDELGGYYIRTKAGKDSARLAANHMNRLGNRLSWDVLPGLKLRWDGNVMRRRQLLDEFKHDIYDSYSNVLGVDFRPGSKSHWSLTHRFDASLLNRRFPALKQKMFRQRDLMQQLRLQYDLDWRPGCELNLGLEGQRESIRTFLIANAKETKSVRNAVFFGQQQLTLTPALRMLLGLRADIHSAYGTHWSPKVSLSYKTGALVLRTGYYHAFKSPSLMELYFDWDHLGMFMIYGNPDLKPETAKQLLFSAEWAKPGFTFSGTVTHTRFHHRIVQYQDAKMDVRFANAPDESRMTVADAAVSWSPLQGWHLKASYCYVHEPVFLELGGNRVNVSLQRPHRWSGDVSYRHAGRIWSYDLNVEGQWLSAIDGNMLDRRGKVQKVRYEGYPMMRLQGSLSYRHHCRLTIGADNLLDYKPDNLRYQTTSLSPGRVLFARLALSL